MMVMMSSMMSSMSQEWKERYGNPREEFSTRNRSSHEMKETSYSDTVPSGNSSSSSRRESRSPPLTSDL